MSRGTCVLGTATAVPDARGACWRHGLTHRPRLLYIFILPLDAGRIPMLVLSRKESQRIRLGDSIVVTIVKISGDKVRVGIEAPNNILVLRDELEPREPATQSAPGAVPAAAAQPAALRHSA